MGLPVVNVYTLFKVAVKKVLAVTFSSVGSFIILSGVLIAIITNLYDFFVNFGFREILDSLVIENMILDFSFVDREICKFISFVIAYDKFVIIWDEIVGWFGLFFDICGVGISVIGLPLFTVFCWRWFRIIGQEAAGVFDE